MPDEQKEADVVQGPLSADSSMVKTQKPFLNQGDKTQFICVSYESCLRAGFPVFRRLSGCEDGYD
ncbi:hypothetical protein EYZ11_004710 [Aspergillus tanneri]|uniref:Uncharacterized protein n=1 Tax=Aspergillus tanneri TaxID=1220188 RepID=A0A4S3JKC8_9EURO|nr:hypothetical protein EYZ11_004710 [Aspergillus tanneri]